MPDSSTNAKPEPTPEPCPSPAEMSEPDCTCSHITGDAYCARHGGDGLEPEPTPEYEQDRHGVPTFTFDENAPAPPDPTPPGLTLSEDGSLLNWQGENYVRQGEPRPDFPACCRKHDAGGEHDLNSGAYEAGWRAGFRSGHDAGWLAGKDYAEALWSKPDRPAAQASE